MNRNQFFENLKKAENIVEKYGWQDRKVHPYSFWMPVKDLLKPMKDYDSYSRGSQLTFHSELKGLMEILEVWEQEEQRKTIKVRITAGKHAGEIKMVTEDYLEIMGYMLEVIGTAS